jgi:hypothetical protein
MRKGILYSFILGTILAIGITSLNTPLASAAYFNQNRIIDDVIFDNSASMTAAEINNFLNSFPNSCISPNSGFAAILPTGYNPTNGFSYGGYVSAGEVIKQAAVVYGINPQVLLATLQKEQSLVAGGAGFCENGGMNKYAAAVGYGCPDSGGSYNYSGVSLYRRNGTVMNTVNGTCVNSAAKAGFSQQVIRAAWLFKFAEQRSKGNLNWAVVNGSWNNSDDPQSCYSGPMTEGIYQVCPSGTAVYYSGVTNIDGVAVHMDSGGTAALYWYTPHFHGNQSFSDLFTSWFGNPTMSSAIKSPSSGAVYMLVNGYKVAVPSMAILQDFGISPSSIQTISQANFDAIPVPDAASGISPVIGPIIKSTSDSDADGGAAYLVSIGKKSPITSLAQFNDFGFDPATISYLPLGYILSLPGGQPLSNFIHTPDGAIFQASGGTKHWYLDQASYVSANPSHSLTEISAYTASTIASGLPAVNYDVLMRNTVGTVFLLTNGSYYTLPSNDVYNCWGFGTTLATPLHFLSDSDGTSNYVAPYVSSGQIGCMVNDGTTNYLMNGTNKLTVPSGFGITTPTSPSLVMTVANKLPTRQAPLRQYIKANNAAPIWYLDNGSKRAIPSQLDFALLGLTIGQVDVIEPGAAAIPPANGVKLATGRAAKTDDNGAIYIINGDSRAVFTNAEDYQAYGYNWNEILTIPAATLNEQYPNTGSATVSRYLFDQAANKYYLVEPQGCEQFTTNQLTDYGQDSSAIAIKQTFPSTLFYRINLSHCVAGSNYAKPLGQNTIYWITGGQKRPFSSWNALVQQSGTANPIITIVSPSTLQPLAQGPTVF